MVRGLTDKPRAPLSALFVGAVRESARTSISRPLVRTQPTVSPSGAAILPLCLPDL